MSASSLARLAANRAAALQRLFDFLAIPSISTQESRAADCDRAADWLVGAVQDIGFDARKVEAGGRPAVLARGPRVAEAPHVLFYGHYDVQPADPDEVWDRPPFEPALVWRDGRQVIHGRGAADDKGQLMTFLEACRALHESGGLPLNVTLLIEGEEEIGSPSMAKLLQVYAQELRADVALVCDTEMLDRRTPAMACQLRGFVGEIVTITGAREDLHSGNYGGAARNPAQIMAQALAALRAPDGSVALDGFYDGVPELPQTVREDWARLGDVERKWLPDVGLCVPAGERGRSVLEQVWSRPCFDINSLWSGYLGAGFKTVLPASAHAKVSFRLVGTQQPDRVRAAFRDAVRGCVPDDCSVHFEAYAQAPPTQMDVTRREYDVVRRALVGLWEAPCVLIGMGGSIPVVGLLKAVLGLDSLLLGFGQSDDRIHAPNEKYDLDSFEKGAQAWLLILAELAQSDETRRAAVPVGEIGWRAAPSAGLIPA